MSEELQLTQELIQDIQSTIVKHDANATDDMISVQYMAASIGFLIGQLSMSPAQENEILDQLTAIEKHIITQVRPQPMAPPQQEAFGIWRPGDS